MLGMPTIVHVHHVDKEAFLKGNMEPDPDEVALVFEQSPTYAEVLKQVRIDLNLMNQDEFVELEGRHNAGHGVHLRWKFLRITSELHWVAYKETVAESLDKSLELFATVKFDAHVNLDFNGHASPFDGKSPPLMNQSPPLMNLDGRSPPLISTDEYGDDEHEDNEDGIDLHDNNVGDLDLYIEQETMEHDIPYSRCYASDSDDDGPDEDVDEEGFTVKEAGEFEKAMGQDH